MDKKKLAFVLGGGGAYGFAHIGFLKAMQELDIKPDFIVGSSMGAVIGSLYAVGQPVKFMDAFAKEFNYKLLLDFFHRSKRRRKGILMGNSALDLFKILTKNLNFEDTKIPLYMNATNFLSGEETVLSTGNLAEALRASTSIPWIFEPHKLNDKYYVDGGVYDSLPVHIAKNLGADKIIAIGFAKIPETEPEMYRYMRENKIRPGKFFLRKLYNNNEIKRKVPSLSYFQEIFTNIENLLNIALWSEISDNKNNADIYVCPDLNGYTQMSFFDAKEIIERGYKETKQNSESIKKLIER